MPAQVPLREYDPVSYGDLEKRFMLFLWGKPSLLSTSDIDALVGNPWTLSVATEAKLASLRPRLRMEFYQWAAVSVFEYRFLPESAASSTALAGGAAAGMPWATTLAPRYGQQLARNLVSTAMQHFRPEELADLGVYALSQNAIFPTTPGGWDSWKRAMVRDDIALGTALVVALASTDNLRAQITGLIARLPSSAGHFGWFAKLDDLGIHLHPSVLSGLKVKSAAAEVTLGLHENFGVVGAGQVRGIEVAVNNHWLPSATTSKSWELALTAVGRYILEQQAPAGSSRVASAVDLYFRRADFAGSTRIALLARGSATTNFSTALVTAGAVGLEHKTYDVAVLLRLGYSVDPLATPEGGTIGLLFAGGTEPRLGQLRASMLATGDLVTARLANLAMIKATILGLAQLAAHVHVVRTDDIAADLAVWQGYLLRGRQDLRQELATYLAASEAYYLYIGRPSHTVRGTQTVASGPLTPEELQAARQETAQYR